MKAGSTSRSSVRWCACSVLSSWGLMLVCPVPYNKGVVRNIEETACTVGPVTEQDLFVVRYASYFLGLLQVSFCVSGCEYCGAGDEIGLCRSGIVFVMLPTFAASCKSFGELGKTACVAATEQDLVVMVLFSLCHLLLRPPASRSGSRGRLRVPRFRRRNRIFSQRFLFVCSCAFLF